MTRCLGDSGGISWLPPVMCFSIIVGLGLDYDVFLISRVFEFRDQGYTDHSAAVKVTDSIVTDSVFDTFMCVRVYKYAAYLSQTCKCKKKNTYSKTVF